MQRVAGGQALVETAISIPLLLAMVWAVFGFGRLYTAQLAITNATREGARLGSLGQSPPAIGQAVASYLTGAAVTVPPQVAVTGAGGQAGSPLTVAVMVPVPNPVSIPGLPAVVDLSATATMQVE
ncbi:MAG: pilus assembly protein [Cyanobacteria bacterium REEB65]|nr:pilus assembly protein [Cyanobacteria bacterium REEB65]